MAPFNVADFVLPNERTGDLVHRFYQEQLRIDGGKMDKFVAWSDAAGLAMSYRLIGKRWGLAPLGTRDAAANGLAGAFP